MKTENDDNSIVSGTAKAIVPGMARHNDIMLGYIAESGSTQCENVFSSTDSYIGDDTSRPKRWKPADSNSQMGKGVFYKLPEGGAGGAGWGQEITLEDSRSGDVCASSEVQQAVDQQLHTLLDTIIAINRGSAVLGTFRPPRIERSWEPEDLADDIIRYKMNIDYVILPHIEEIEKKLDSFYPSQEVVWANIENDTELYETQMTKIFGVAGHPGFRENDTDILLGASSAVEFEDASGNWSAANDPSTGCFQDAIAPGAGANEWQWGAGMRGARSYGSWTEYFGSACP